MSEFTPDLDAPVERAEVEELLARKYPAAAAFVDLIVADDMESMERMAQTISDRLVQDQADLDAAHQLTEPVVLRKEYGDHRQLGAAPNPDVVKYEQGASFAPPAPAVVRFDATKLPTQDRHGHAATTDEKWAAFHAQVAESAGSES